MIAKNDINSVYSYVEKCDFPEVNIEATLSNENIYQFAESKIDIRLGKIQDKFGEEIPLKFIEDQAKENPELGELTYISANNPVSNLKWHWLKINDANLFRPAALAFEESVEECKGTGQTPAYCPHLKGTMKYTEFWTEERRRCTQGYEPEIDGKPLGIKIPGEFYFYLNYFRIRKLVVLDTGESVEDEGFPNFTLMDYYWFKELDARENPYKYGLPKDYKKSIILAKSRRLGFSYKNACGAVHKYSFYKNTKVLIVSQLGAKAFETFEKCIESIDFLSQYTEFGGPHIYRTMSKTTNKGAIKAGVKTKDGKERGRKTEIYTISVNNKDDAASGAGCSRVIFEEAGMIKNLKSVWGFTEPTLKSGALMKGIGIIFGTGGEMESDGGDKGSSLEFSEMFYDPKGYELADYLNIYDGKDPEGRCGLFFNISWFSEGAEFTDMHGKDWKAFDVNGNIRPWVAELAINKRRYNKRKDRKAFETELTQYCKIPREAFLKTKGSVFDTASIEERINTFLRGEESKILLTNGRLVQTEGNVKFLPDLEGLLDPVDTYPIKRSTTDLNGCITIAEQPKFAGGEVPFGSYIVTIDPIGIDSDGGKSMAAIYVLKTGTHPVEIGTDDVVAWYVGRPKINPVDTINRTLVRLCRYYNAVCTHENDRMGKEIRTYFLEKGEYHRLLPPPVDIVNKSINSSNTNKRQTGHSMSSQAMKELGEMYIDRFLMKERPSGRTNLDTIPDLGLLQELQAYNRHNNYDRVMALMGGVIQIRQIQSQMERTSGSVDNISEQFRSKIIDKDREYHYSKLRRESDIQRTTTSNMQSKYNTSDSRNKFFN